MKVLLLVAALLSSLGARAQEYYLDLRYQRLVVPGRTVAVEQVLDGRRGNLAIGHAYQGLSSGHARTIFFRQEAGAELTAFVKSQLPARPTDHPLVLCLRRLYLDENVASVHQTAEAYLSLDAYLHLPDGYHFVQGVGAHTSTTTQQSDVTPLHVRHLAQLLAYSLGQLAGADWDAARAQPARTLGQLPADEPAALPAREPAAARPAILREAPRRGLYRTFAQFLSNRPDTTQAFVLDTLQPSLRSYAAWQQWQRVPWVRPLVTYRGGQVAVPDHLWGFSDGQFLFVRREQYFFPLLRQGQFFTTVGTAPELDKATLAAARATRLVSDAIDLNIPDVPKGYALDMRSGELHPYPGLAAPTRPDTALVYVYRPVAAPGPAQLQVWLNGKQVGELRPGEYLALGWPYYATLFSLCLTSGPAGSACQYLLPDRARPNYLRVAFTPEAPLWQWVPPIQGRAEVAELAQLRRPGP